MARKDKGRFYREVLHAANPRVAALPSHERGQAAAAAGAPALDRPRPPAPTPTRCSARSPSVLPGLLSEGLHEVISSGPDALTRFSGWNDRFWVRGSRAVRRVADRLRERLTELAPPF
ncbi:hypothetical protein GCM10020219_065580 [Nonomuraea dietziae]